MKLDRIEDMMGLQWDRIWAFPGLAVVTQDGGHSHLAAAQGEGHAVVVVGWRGVQDGFAVA